MILKKPDTSVINQLLLTSACAFGLLLASYSNANAQLRSGSYKDRVAFVTGGIGQDERDELNTKAREYSLHITYANASAREYLGDVDVVIKDKDQHIVFEDKNTGPFLYVNLPEGEYDASFVYEGKTKKQKITVTGNPQQKLILTWQ